LKLSKEDVEHVAHLARLNFREEDKEKFTLQLNDILVYMDILNKVNTTGVEPMTHAITLNNAFRDDEVKGSVGIEKTLANAPDRMGECFRVPKVIE
jgi:aspartyl-tRNA(Asn)/glutamyl-tRNA(Gln) amidotransferase subunit C